MKDELTYNPQYEAGRIERMLRSIFQCERGGFGDEICADAIRKHPYLSVTQGLAFLYARYPNLRDKIESFNRRYSCYYSMSMDDMLKVEADEPRENDDNQIVMTSDFKNTLEAERNMIREFRFIIKNKAN